MSSHPPPTRTPNLRQTRLPGATDNTRYGEGAASPHSFLKISTAIQAADAQTILNAASSRVLGSRLTSVNVHTHHEETISPFQYTREPNQHGGQQRS